MAHSRHWLRVSLIALLVTLVALAGCRADRSSSSGNGDGNGDPRTDPPPSPVDPADSLLLPAQQLNQFAIIQVMGGDEVIGLTSPEGLGNAVRCTGASANQALSFPDLYLVEKASSDDDLSVIAGRVVDGDTGRGVLAALVEGVAAAALLPYPEITGGCGGFSDPDTLADQVVNAANALRAEGEAQADFADTLEPVLLAIVDARQAALDAIGDGDALGNAIAAELRAMASLYVEVGGLAAVFADLDLAIFPDIYQTAGGMLVKAADQVDALEHGVTVNGNSFDRNNFDSLVAPQLELLFGDLLLRVIPTELLATELGDNSEVANRIRDLENEIALISTGVIESQLITRNRTEAVFDDRLRPATQALFQAIRDAVEDQEPGARCGDNLPILGPILCGVLDGVSDLFDLLGLGDGGNLL